MKKYSFIYLLITSVIILNCGGTGVVMAPPEEGKNLLMDSILFENIGYSDRYQFFTEDIEVAILGFYEEDGKQKVFGKWVVTDSLGYFFIPNVPDGNYAIKGFRVDIETGYLTIANDFRSGVSNYVRTGQNIAFAASGDHFENLSKNHIVNLKHNRFTIHVTGEIRHGRHDVVTNFKTSSGEAIERPFIHEYFLEKYPDSGWEAIVRDDLRLYKGDQ